MGKAGKSAGAGPAAAEAAAGGFAAEVFGVLAQRLGQRSEAIALFAQTGGSWNEWCTWEVLAACREAAWTTQPQPPYADVGVAGSRDRADLLVFDPTSGRRVLLELAVIHDWTTNKWIDTLNGDTERLRRAAAVGVVGLQVILAASLDSPIDVNPKWQGWLSMSEIWTRPTKLRQALQLGTVGQMVIQGWALAG
ncbi:MAG: hypothetical protein ACYS15_05885 [Planctomycetota bacterium]